jgi:hypothetical protein
MHPPGAVARALRLGSEGLNAVEIAHDLAIPRRTVADWLAGKVPRRSRGLEIPTSSCERCGHEAHEFRGLPDAYVYLLGLCFGDGCISSGPRGVYRLRITLDIKYPRIIEETARAMRLVMPRNKSSIKQRPKNCVEVYSCSKSWPCLFPQHGPGKKHLRRIELEPWQQDLVARSPGPILRGLIQSDGCRFINTGRQWTHPRYAFCNLSEDIKKIFCETCDLLGLRWTRSGPKTIYVSRKADVAVLDRIVGPKQ